MSCSASLLPNHALVERIFADRLHDLENAVRNHDRALVEKMLEEEAHTRRLTMIEHDMLRKKVNCHRHLGEPLSTLINGVWAAGLRLRGPVGL